MNVYKNVVLVGVTTEGEDFNMALRVQPLSNNTKKKHDWEETNNLQYGNLLCISINGDFKNMIWATVTNRDLLLKKDIVLVRTCAQWNTSDDAAIILDFLSAKGKQFTFEPRVPLNNIFDVETTQTTNYYRCCLFSSILCSSYLLLYLFVRGCLHSRIADILQGLRACSQDTSINKRGRRCIQRGNSGRQKRTPPKVLGSRYHIRRRSGLQKPCDQTNVIKRVLRNATLLEQSL